MPKKGWKSFTVSDDVFERFEKYSKVYNMSMDEVIIHLMDNKNAYARFAKNITKVPESVRVYV